MTQKLTYEELEHRVKKLEKDESEHKKTEEALRESEERFRAIFDQTFQFIGLMNIEGILIEANRASLDFYGISESDVMGMPFWETLWWTHSPEQQNTLRDAVNRAASGEFVRFEASHPAPDGVLHYVDISIKPLKDEAGNVYLLIPEGRDITERKQAEEALRKERDKAQQYLDIAGVILVVLNADQTVALINKKGCEILGYEESEIIGKKWFDNILPERDRERTRASFCELIAGNVKQIEFFENNVLTKNNEERLIAWHNAVIRNDEGEIIATLSSGEDITRRKLAEEELQKSYDELESRVEERTRELELKTQSLEELNTAMNVLLKKREEDKTEVEQNVMTNVRELIEPYFEKIKKTKLDDHQEAFMNILESNLNEIVSPFTRKLSLKYLSLTPKEIQIVNMIKIGYPSKKIANLMNISPRTVDTHRKNIRSKIGLGQKRANLRSHLLAYEQ